jgi:initiation factor 1A
MPKKTKSFKNNKEEKKTIRPLQEKDDNTEYGLVTKVLGGCRFIVKLNMQNKEVLGHLRGKFTKGVNKKDNIVEINSVVLVSIRDFDDKVVDIIHVYKPDEIRQLKKSGQFVEQSVRGETDIGDDYYSENNDDVFDFTEI